MGYTTKFDGVLKFTKELTVDQLRKLETFINHEDPDNHPEWIKEEGVRYSYIQFELTSDYDGIQWDGSEKFYEAVSAVNLIITNMQAEFPDFGLTGELLAQGEEVGDVWILAIENGRAVEKRCKAQADDLKIENEKLRKALEFYRDNFVPVIENPNLPGFAWKPTETLLDDCGEIAKAALGESA